MRTALCVGWIVLFACDALAAELLVFDWNKPVTKAMHGFPWDQPPLENGDWTQPVNHAGGTLHYRVEILSQPVAQDMKLQFCFWQQTPSRESCGPLQQIKGTPGAVATWSCDVGSMWNKDGLPIEWTLPRYRNGVAIKDLAGQPVSDYAGWSWNGHDPDDWYPLDMRFTVVVVEQGKTFSGWSSYVAPAPDAGVPPDQTAPKPDMTAPDAVSPPPDQTAPGPDVKPSDAAVSVDATVGVDAGPPAADGSSAGTDRGATAEIGPTLPDVAGGPGRLEGGAGCSVGGGGALPLGVLLLVLLAGAATARRRSP